MALAERELHRSADVRLVRVTCDGVDDPRAETEPSDGDQIVVVLRGCFELRADVRTMVDPWHASVLRADREYGFRHPASHGDVCLAIGGALATRVGHSVSWPRPLTARAWGQLHGLARGPIDNTIAVEETIWSALGCGDRPPARPRRERDLAAHVTFLLSQRIDCRVTLAELADAVGYSEFHLCRLFRRATGMTIQAFHRELRLRHALALVRETRLPLAEIANESGFSSQAHLTTQFRGRYGITPGRAREQFVVDYNILTRED